MIFNGSFALQRSNICKTMDVYLSAAFSAQVLNNGALYKGV
jgi:hypothetical protein